MVQQGKLDGLTTYIFDEELILLGEDGAPFLEGFKQKAYIIRGKTWVNNHAHVLRAISSIALNSYLKHYLDVFDYHEFVTGTTRLKLNQGRMRKIPIVLPPLPEQERIVAKIEETFTQLEAGVAELQNAKAQLKRYRAAVLKSAVEGELTREWREAHQDEVEPAEKLLARILEERREKWEAEGGKGKYKEPAAPNTDDLPELPEGWVWTYIEPLLETTRDGMRTGPFGSLLKKHEHQEEGVPVIGIENIGVMQFVPGSKIHITKEKAEQLAKYDIQEGDVVISRSGTVGEVTVIPEGLGDARFSTNVMRITLAPLGMRPKYLAFF